MMKKEPKCPQVPGYHGQPQPCEYKSHGTKDGSPNSGLPQEYEDRFHGSHLTVGLYWQ